MDTQIYDLVIIGGGPAGVTAGVYAARKQLKSVLITDAFGGQSTVSEDIQNWIGFPHISGMELAKKLEEHLREYADDTLLIDFPIRAESLTKNNDLFIVKTSADTEYQTRAVLLALGSKRRKLPAKNADIFEHKGVTYCASCDGPMFTGKDVAVIGGGNAGFETAAQLLAYAKSVTLFEFADKFAADEITVNKLLQNPKFKAISNAQVTEILGEQFVSGIKYKDRTTNDEKEISLSGVFVEIGMIPNTEIAKNIVELNDYNQIKADPRTQKTTAAGIWAAGDCTDGLYHQNNIASGDAVKALEDIYIYLNTN